MSDPDDFDRPLGPDQIRSVELALYRAAVGAEITQTVNTPSGTTTTVPGRTPPDTKAATAILSAYTDRYSGASPVTAVQFVMMLPDVAPTSTIWLERIRARQAGTAMDGQVEAGRVDPASSGPVPDPLPVPSRSSAIPVPHYENDPVPLDVIRPLEEVLAKNMKG